MIKNINTKKTITQSKRNLPWNGQFGLFSRHDDLLVSIQAGPRAVQRRAWGIVAFDETCPITGQLAPMDAFVLLRRCSFRRSRAAMLFRFYTGVFAAFSLF